jgi:tetratricopeptide (TPR) repeat protein
VTYRAFLSYSHRDKAQAVAWHQRLESLSIPDDLHGATTPLGPVPPHLRPIFRDELDFEPGRELTQATRDALDASAALILIASPNARISAYVNAEVRHFRATWPERPIIPILCGPRGTAFRDHLPPALAYELDGDGQPTTAEHTPLASNPRSGTEATRIRVAARALGLTGPRLTVWVREAERAAREQRERDQVAKERHRQTQRKLDGQDAKLDRLLALAEASGVFDRATEQGISEAAVRGIVERLGGQNIAPDDLIPWLDNWIEHARVELDRHSNEGAAYDAAWRRAEALFNAGRMAEVADPFMEELRREEAREAERLAERRRHRLALLEAAIDFDTRALNIDAIPPKLRLIAAENGVTSPDALGLFLHDWANERDDYGRDKGDNTALLVAIATWRAALEELTRDRVPLDWAVTQNNLGNALWTLGARESGTARLEEAVAAYRAALQEWTRDRVPLQWAATQNNLGIALWTLGERESGTARLE